MTVAELLHILFAHELGRAIGADGAGNGGFVLCNAAVLTAGEHIIGGDVYQSCTGLFRCLCQIAGAEGICLEGGIMVHFAAVHIGVGSAVDDDIRAVGIRKGADFGGDSHIHFRHIGGDQLVFFAVKPCTQRLTKMAVGTADPNFEHCCFPPSGTGQ